MQQIFGVWSALSMQRRVTVVIASLAMFAAILVIARLASAPSMALLYNGLEPGPAGEVVRALEQRNVAHEVRGGAIYVESRTRDQLRMTLASEGLPATGTKGYELLDGLSGFGTTSQMFDAAYWRAKEGELARTIMGSRSVSSARVHISQVNNSPFKQNARAAASVTVNTTGGPLTGNQIRAFKYLIASAVAGIEPAGVAVIDGATGLVTADDGPNDTTTATDRAEDLRQKVSRLLEARVGPGNAVVEISLETATETESIRERRFDPTSRVAISTDSESSKTNSKDKGGSDVTVASNLPDGDGANATASSSENTQSRERVNYEVSETERQITRGPGEIRRLTVAVLVNHVQITAEDGSQVLSERPTEELAILEALVASAVGFDAERGDRITLKTLPFEPVLLQGSQSGSVLFQISDLDLISLIQFAVLALVALILGLFVVRPILAGQKTDGRENLPMALADQGGLPAQNSALSTAPEDTTLVSSGAIVPTVPEATQIAPVDRLRGLIGERQDETIEILQSWMEDGAGRPQ
ncbi:flagellar basal-body MS-ring/collar protein FliF [Cognatishimia sp. WU-CL00825]|uniref:flagellar basal-body MS-ring/collar protein FliF n=1 Tax=Cognatishimia sp. WU-CL00825 TaxID=3127658 RepID=UPI00310AE4A8